MRKIADVLLGGWNSKEIKKVCIEEAKRIFFKVVKAFIYKNIKKRIEDKIVECRQEVSDLKKKWNLPDDNFDPRDIRNFMAA